MQERLAISKTIWLYPLAVLSAVSMAAFAVVHLLDCAASRGVSFLEVFRQISPSDAAQIMGGVGEVIAAILGIVITVASIIVQLAANRYTPRITEMFFRDRKNLLVMAFFIVSAVFSLWVNFSIRQGSQGPSFVPYWGVIATIVLLTFSLLLMVPYFNYVFDFLEPDKVVGRIKSAGVAVALERRQKEPNEAIDERRITALSSLEQLADIALNAVQQKDKGIASKTIDSIAELVTAYVSSKSSLDPRWFEIRDRLLRDPDFVSMNAEALGKLSHARTWLEYKALRQFLMVYREAIEGMPDLTNRIAINTRYIGETAIAADDKPLLAIVIKFFNTYMRRALNARNVAAAFNNLNQYRYLTEKLLRSGFDDEVIQVAGHFKYYAQTAQAMKLAFVTETVAFDLCTINELADDIKSPCSSDLLKIFLDVDKEAEVEQQESSLRGVRKAQIKLATYYLWQDKEDLARLIHRDMSDERPDRLMSIKDELLMATTDEFWEINDRGGVFEYMEPVRRQKLHQFFSWFPKLEARRLDPKDSLSLE